MEKVREFIAALHADPRAKELVGESDPANREEALALYAKAAGALGFSLTAEEIVEGIDRLAQEQKDRTASAEKEVTLLESDDMDMVAGGTEACSNTYNPDENCSFNDRCNSVFMSYRDEIHCTGTYECDYVFL